MGVFLKSRASRDSRNFRNGDGKLTLQFFISLSKKRGRSIRATRTKVHFSNSTQNNVKQQSSKFLSSFKTQRHSKFHCLCLLVLFRKGYLSCVRVCLGSAKVYKNVTVLNFDRRLEFSRNPFFICSYNLWNESAAIAKLLWYSLNVSI